MGCIQRPFWELGRWSSVINIEDEHIRVAVEYRGPLVCRFASKWLGAMRKLPPSDALYREPVEFSVHHLYRRRNR